MANNQLPPIQRDRDYTWRKVPPPLADLAGTRPLAPDWFSEALAMREEVRFIDVDGCPIETVSWGDPSSPGVMLVHGAMAHARWWTPVAHLLARHYRVVAMSYSGMGDSGRRDRYSVRQVSREIYEAMRGSGLFDNGRRPLLVAHSFGGKPAAIVAADHGEDLLGAVFVDSHLMPDLDAKGPIEYRQRTYASENDAIARFRLAPDQPPTTSSSSTNWRASRSGRMETEAGPGNSIPASSIASITHPAGMKPLVSKSRWRSSGGTVVR